MVKLHRPTRRISNDGSERRIAPQALATFKARIRNMTCRTLGKSDSLGLPRLYVSVEAQPVEPPRYVTRMPGGVGGVAP